MKPSQTTAIIVAAGTGSRMGVQVMPKQFLPVGGMPILAHTLKRFDSATVVDHIVLVIRPEDRERCETLIAEHGIAKAITIVDGGKERQDSVLRGLRAAPPQTEIVLIHDAVRMFVTEEMLHESIDAARHIGASVVAVPAKDTIKEAVDSANGAHNRWPLVAKTYNRRLLWQIQTPQTFQYQLILDCYERAIAEGFDATDDAMMAEYSGHPVALVTGSYRNIKITTPDDLLMAEAFLQRQDGRDARMCS